MRAAHADEGTPFAASGLAEHGIQIYGIDRRSNCSRASARDATCLTAKARSARERIRSLAKDGNLEAGGYPVYVVVRGQRAMPPVGAMMSDDQVAAVVNYVRTHFGNQYQDAVTAEDVKRVRPIER